MTTKSESTFKVKASIVDTHFGIPPERGALLFLETDHKLIYGDGYNWMDLGPGSDLKDAVALERVNPLTIPMVAGVEQQVSFYDLVVYIYGKTIIPSGGNEVNIKAAMDVDLSAEYCVKTDTPNVAVTVTQRYNGVEVSRVLDLVHVNEGNTIQEFNILTTSPADTFTAWAKANKDCIVTLCNARIGLHERT